MLKKVKKEHDLELKLKLENLKESAESLVLFESRLSALRTQSIPPLMVRKSQWRR